MQVEKVSYQINWKKFKRGYSFFIPCLDPKSARKEIKEVTDRLKYKILTKAVIEEGVRCLRVWRL